MIEYNSILRHLDDQVKIALIITVVDGVQSQHQRPILRCRIECMLSYELPFRILDRTHDGTAGDILDDAVLRPVRAKSIGIGRAGEHTRRDHTVRSYIDDLSLMQLK